jgi:hypothetical protein
LTARNVRPIIAAIARILGMTDPNRDRHERSIHRMTWIAFILAAVAGLISIIYVRPLSTAEEPPPAIKRSP